MGKKIQGIGHDGERESKKEVLNKLINLLTEDGIWIEASDKLEDVLRNRGAKPVTDIKILRKLYPYSKIVSVRENGQYDRTINNRVITETTFGKPKFY